MILKKIYCVVLFVLVNICMPSVYAQSNSTLKKPKIDKNRDNPQARINFEILKTKDPKTNRVPKNIRLKELTFMRKQIEKQGIPLVPGDRVTSWINRGPRNVGGRTRALAVDVRNENIILAGGISGGIWRSTDGGTSWTKTTGASELQNVSCIAQDTRSGQRDVWYYGTGEFAGNSAGISGNGIYKSTDNGETWILLSTTGSNTPQSFDSNFDYNYELVVDPTNGDILVANYGGIYLSTDGGSSFTFVLGNVSSENNGTWSDIVISSEGVAYVALDIAGIFRSSNGIDWTDITPSSDFPLVNRERKELALASSNENILYLLGEDATNKPGYSLWRFDESSETWEDLSDNIPRLGGLTGDFDSQGGYDLLITVKPDDENFVLIGGINLFRSTDGFSTNDNTSWIGGYTPENTTFAQYPNQHPDQHSFIFLSNDKAISGNDGGLYLTSNIRNNLSTFPVTWSPLNNGYLTTQVYALSVGSGNQIMAGFQDNGTWLTIDTNASTNWTKQFSGDGAYSAFNSDGTVRYLSAQNGVIFRGNYSDADDVSFDDYAPFNPRDYNARLFIVPFYLDPLNDNLFYLGGAEDLYVNTSSSTGDQDNGWKTIRLPDVQGVVSEMGVTTNNTLYVGTNRGSLYRINNPGNNPSVIDIKGSNFPTGYISGVSVNQFNVNEILVSFSNYSVRSIFYSTDGGASWTDVSGNLEENANGTGNGPSVRTTRILGNASRYFVGTSTGLYSATSLTSNTVWIQEDPNGIGEVVVEHLVERSSDGLLAVGTHGNGIYTARFDVSRNIENDLSVTGIPSPTNGTLTDNEMIMTTVLNSGSLSQTNFALTLEINDNIVVTDNISTTIPSGQTYSHTFSVAYNFSEIQSYNTKVTLTNTDDENLSNNTFSRTVLSLSTLPAFPYSESFEGDVEGWTANSLWELGTPNQTNLNRAFDGTKAWMTDLDGNYSDNTRTFLESPVFNFTSLSSPILSFVLNYDIEADYDGLTLGYRTAVEDGYRVISSNSSIRNWYNNTASDLPVWSGSTRGGYVRSAASLGFLSGESYVQFAFVFLSDENINFEGVAIDAFDIREKPAKDLAIGSVALPGNIPEGEQTLTVVVKNLGRDSQNNFEIVYYVDANLVQNVSINENITSTEILNYTFEQAYNFVPGIHEIQVIVKLNNDENNFNDTLVQRINVLPIISNYPYLESFEAADQGWIGNTLWELGMPNQNDLNRASEGTRAWMTDLNENYINSVEAFLESPIFNFSNLSFPVISFDLNYTIEQFYDGLVLGYRTHIDSNYLTSTAFGVDNWYDQDLDDSDLSVWSGTTNGNYVRVVGNLKDLAEQPFVQFAFFLVSDGSVVDEGAAVDNLKIEEMQQPPTDISLSNNIVREDQLVGTFVGRLNTIDPNSSDAHTYRLSGTDFGSFSVTRDSLLTAQVFDMEVKNSYQITITTTDQSNLSFSKDFTINVESVTALPDASIDNQGLVLYPNPTNNSFKIKGLENLTQVKISIVTLTGQVVKQFNQIQIEYDIRDLPIGTYIAVVEFDGKYEHITFRK